MIKVLIVDDSPIVRKILARGLQADPNIEVVGQAADPFEARDFLVQNEVDVVTLDIEMPKMNGLVFLKKVMPQQPFRFIMVSSLTQSGCALTMECLQYGALDFVGKPNGGDEAVEQMIVLLRNKINAAAQVDITRYYGRLARNRKKNPLIQVAEKKQESQIKLIAIGASTGGPQAIRQVLSSLKAPLPGIVVVQHMPPGFTQSFARHLDSDFAQLSIKEAETGDLVLKNRVFIAPGDRQLAVEKDGGELRLKVFEYEKVSGHCPSVDVLFSSVADCNLNGKVVALLLTGMGKDGAKGLQRLFTQGAHTVGESKDSCVVYGMSQEAARLGALQKEISLDEMGKHVTRLL